MSTPTKVSAPFLPPSGDVILRSSDNQDFYVVKAILTIASPFFQSLFTLPQPEAEVQGDLPTVDVPEDSRTLDTLLRFCYPIRNPVVNDLGLAAAGLTAATKYEMEFAVQGLCRVLVSEKALEEQAVRVYAIACRYRLVEEAHLAAIATLRAPIEEIYVKEFETLPTVYYFNLLKYQRKVKTEICAVLNQAIGRGNKEEKWRPTIDSMVCRCESTPGAYWVETEYPAEWWKVLISERVIPLVRRSPLHPNPFSESDFMETKSTIGCSTCKSSMGAQWNLAVASLRELFNRIANDIAFREIRF